MLVEQTLWGPRDKVQIAIDRLRQFEPSEGYYLAFSGGKDSITIYRLAQLAGVRFDAHYEVTTIDPPELMRFIRQEYPAVEWHRPELTMWQLILKEGMPPMRQRRYCCEALKESGGSGRTVVTGIRWAESVNRQRRRMVETCFKDSTKTFLHPVIDWPDEDIWQFIHQEDLAYCSLYDEGFTRIGCVLCPMGAYPERDMARWPKYMENYIRTFDRLLEKGRAEGKTFTWKTGKDLFDWWIRRRAKSQVSGQMTLFEW